MFRTGSENIERQQSILARLWATVVLLLGVGLLLLAGLIVNADYYRALPVLIRAIARIVLDAALAVCLLGIVFVWWRPAWLKQRYESSVRWLKWILLSVSVLALTAVTILSLLE